MTRTRVAIWAPWAAAVRATTATMRASSSAASWNCTAPTSASGRSAGRDGQRAAPAQVPVTRHRSRSADGVVEREPRAEVGALPAAPAQRPQERHGRDEVGSDPREQQLALAQRLAHEPDVAHLEVAQAAVDELARGARGPGREVARLDEADAQAARGRVERRARARDPAADDEQVELARGRRLERPPPRGRVERAVRHLAADLRLEQRPQRGVEPPVAAMQVVVDAAQLRVGLHGRAARAGHRRAAAATLGCSPAPAAASIAAPRAVVSTSSGRHTGRPVTFARSSHSSRPLAPPPTQTTSRGGWPAPPIASITSRSASALPSSSARARWARPCAAVIPNQPARACEFHSGAIAPASAGIHETPPAPGGARSASAFNSS